MRKASRKSSAVDSVVANRTRLGNRSKRRRQLHLESLESRIVLTPYTFTFSGTTATASGGTNSGSLIIAAIGGNLGHSQNGGSSFSMLWGGNTVPATAAITVDISVSSGAGSSLQLGYETDPASTLHAAFDVSIPTNISDICTIDDSGGTEGSASTYSIDLGNTYTVTGPNINYTESAGIFGGGVNVKGSAVNGNSYNVLSTFATEPVSVVTAASTSSTVNVGSAGTVGGIAGTLSVYDPADGTTLNVNDASDTTHPTATLDYPDVNPNAPYEVAGLSPAPIYYGTGVMALNVYGGTYTAGLTGVTYDVYNTQSGTTTTIYGGSDTNTYNLSESSQTGGLNNLPGPVVIDGGGDGDSIVVSDQHHNGPYTYDLDTGASTATITSSGAFGGLTYSGLGAGAVTLYTAFGGPGNTVNVDDTANNVATQVWGSNGVDTIDVNGTGTGGSLVIRTRTTAGSTVNVKGDQEPVYISSGANATVNIGFTGNGMTGIGGPIFVANTASPTSLTALNFNDEGDGTGRTWTLDNDDAISIGIVALSGGIATTIYDPAELSALTIDGSGAANVFNVDDTSGYYVTTLNTGEGTGTATNVFASGDNTLNINVQAVSQTITLGGVLGVGMQELQGNIDVAASNGGSAAFTLDDSEDSIGQAALLSNDGSNSGTVTGLSPATIGYTDASISGMTVYGGYGGNAFTVDGTTVNGSFSPTVTNIYKGYGAVNYVDVEATSAGSILNIYGQGSGVDYVTLGEDLMGPVNIEELDSGTTAMTIDLTDDGFSHDFSLYASTAGTSTLEDMNGYYPTITYTTSSLSSLTIDTDPALSQTLNIDFGGYVQGDGGNPIPYAAGVPGLFFNADGDGTSLATPGGTHLLNIEGELSTGPFSSETHDAGYPLDAGPGHFGDMAFNDGQALTSSVTGLVYTGLQPITDTADATNYIFNDYGYPDQSFSVTTPGTVVPLVPDSIEFASTPTPSSPTNFETTDILNKVNVTFNTPAFLAGVPTTGLFGLINLPTAYTGAFGLASFTVNTSTGNTNNVVFDATPTGVVTSLNGSTATDVTGVTGLGVASGTTLTLDGGPNANTLTYDAGGETPVITKGAAYGEVLITIPGAGTVDALYYGQINIVDLATPPPPAIGTPPVAVTAPEGVQLVNQLVGTFTYPLASLFPTGTVLPTGLPASDFTANINWGDSTPVTGGTITQDATNPDLYYVTGQHTYTTPGSFTISISVTLAAGSITGTFNNTPITLELSSVSVGPGTSADVTVNDGTLAVTAFPIVATEGLPLVPGTIATFIDAGGADPIPDYTVTAAITNSTGFSLLIPASDFNIAQVGTSDQFTVTLLADPANVIPDAGTYTLVVTVTDKSNPATPFSSTGSSTVTVADAPLTAGPAIVFPQTSAGTEFSGIVGSFTDANPTAPISDFTATINWGDGTGLSGGTISQPGGVGTTFDVSGMHTYAFSGTYTITTFVTDKDGATVTLTNTIDVEYPNLYLQGNTFLVSLNPAKTMIGISVDGTLTSYIAADVDKIYLFGNPGTDSLTVNDANGGIAAPIYFYATSGGPNWMALTGGTATSDTYTPGAAPGSGTSKMIIGGVTQTVNFTGLSPVYDNVTGPLSVVANNASNAITYEEGSPPPPGSGSSPSWGEVAIDTSEPINFSNKTTLAISGLGGNDDINLSDPYTPTGLASIAVSGGPSGSTNTLVVNSVPSTFNDFGVLPTGAGAGSVSDSATGFVPVSFTGVASLDIVGQAAYADALRVGDTAGSDTVTYTPGATDDAGTITGFSSSGSSFAYTAITFSGITGYVIPISTIGAQSGNDKLIVNGTGGADTFDFAGDGGSPFPNYSSITVDGYAPIFYSPVTLGTKGIVLQGLGGGTTFNLMAATTENGPSLAVPVSVQATGSGNTIIFTANAGATTVVNYATATITSTDANTISFSGVTTVNVDANGGTVTVDGAAGNDSFTYDPLTTSSATVTLSTAAPVLNITDSSGSGVTMDAPGGTVTLVGPTGTAAITATGGGTPSVQIGTSLLLTLDAAGALVITGGAGSDALTVNSTAGAFAIPIVYNGGSAGGNSLVLTGGTASSDTYTPGPAAGAGSSVLAITNGSGGTESVTFTNLAPVFDSVAGTLIVVANNGNNAITYQKGSSPGGPSTAWGQVAIDAFEVINFTGKTGLRINAEDGSDSIVMNNPNKPTGLTTIQVLGDTATTDSLLVNGTTAADTIGYSPTGPGAGSVTVNALPTISFMGMMSVAINGQGGGDSLTVTTLNGNQVTLTPGSAVDSGGLSLTAGAGSPVSFTPLSYSNLGSAGSLIVSGTGDSLVYNGMPIADTFVVTGSNTPASGDGEVVLETTATPAVAQIPVYTAGVTNLVLNGVSGNDTFDVTATTALPLPYTAGITLEGSSTDPANLAGNGTSPVIVTLGGTSTFVTGGGLGSVANPLTLIGINVISVSNGAGAIDFAGMAGIPSDFTVTPTGANTATVQDNGAGPVVTTTNTGFLVIGGASDTNDVVTVDGTAANESFTAIGATPGPGVFVSITSNFKTITLPDPSAMPPIIAAIMVNAGPVGGDLTVDSTAAPFTIPITFNGSAGGGSALILFGGTSTSDDYTPGAAPGAGTMALEFSALDETVNFTNLAPVYDYVTGSLTVIANNASNAITYQAGTAAPGVTGLTWGQVAVDALEVINFANKSSLTIDALGGNDSININNPTVPTGLTLGITVTGNSASTDSLLVNGTGTGSAMGYSPTGPGAGNVTVATLPTVAFTGIGSLAINGQGGGVSLTVTAPSFTQDTLTPGSAIDSGLLTFTSGSPPVSDAPLSYSNLGLTGSLIIASGGEGSTVTLIYNGTTASDTFTVAPTTGTVTLSNTGSGVAQIPVLTPGVSRLILDGISGSDTFDVTGSQPYTSGIALEGGPSDPNVANLTGDGSSPVFVTLGGTTTFVSGGGLGTVANPLTLTGVGVINVANGGNGIDIGGTTGQPNDFAVTPTGANTATVQDNGIGPVVNTTNTGLLFIGSLSDVGDVVTVDGTATNPSFIATAAATGTPITITSSDKTIDLFNPLPAVIGALVVNAGPGSGDLTVDSSAAPFTIPVTFNGGTGGGSALILRGGTATGDTYTPGAAAGAGTVALEFGNGNETVNFTNLQPVYDYIAGPLTVVANNASNAITYQAGTAAPGVTGLTWGQVAVDSLEVINFANKASLTIDALGGNDWINLNNPTVPTGLGSPITVTGDTASTDSLIVNGTTAVDTIGYAPSGPGAGGVTIGGLPSVAFTGIGSLAINGQGGGDSLTVTTGSSDQVTITPGSAVDSGTVSVTSGGGSPVSFTPLSFSNLGSASISSLTVSGAGTLIYDGTTGNDTFTVSGSATPGDGTVSLANSATPPVSQIPVHTVGVTNLVLNGISGDDTFNVTATTALPLPYTSGISLEGGPSDPSVANLTGNGTSAVTVTMGGTATTVTGGGLGTITLSGVGVINVGNGSSDIDVAGTSGHPNNLAVTPTGANTASVQDNATGPVVNTTNTGLLVIGSTTDTNDVVTVDGTAGNGSFLAEGEPVGTAFSIFSSDKAITLLNPTTPPSPPIVASVVVNAGPGNGSLTVDSATAPFTIPITFNGGTGGESSLILEGGTASAVYTPGATPGTGSDVLTFAGPAYETINFTNLAPVYDYLSGSLTVVANNASNTITYQEGSSPSGPSTSWGQVAVDNSEVINFASKTSLTIDTLSGSDAVDINNPNPLSGLAGITVNATGALAGNSLTINGTTGQDAFEYTPSAATTGAGMVTTSSLPSVTFADMGSLAINGQGGNDTLTITTVNGPDSLTLTPGASVDSGTVTITRNLGSPASATPVSYSNLGSTGALTIANGPASLPDTLIYNGTAGLNTFAVAATTGQIILTTSAGMYIPVNTPGVSSLVLNGLGGTDTFDVTGSQPYSSITLEGGTSGPNVANLVGNSASPIVVTLGGTTTTVSGGGLATVGSPVTLIGVGVINVGNTGGGVDVKGTAGQPNDLAVTPTGATTASIQDNGTGPWVYTNDSGALIIGGVSGNSDTVTIDGTAGNSVFTATTAASPTISSADKMVTLNPTGLAALDVNEGPISGSLTINSGAGAFPVPITFNGGTGSGSSLILTGGMASSDVYSPGPAAGAGSVALVIGLVTETVNFTNLSPVFDSVGGPLTVDANNASNAITYQEGDSAPSTPSTSWGQVAVDALEVINFTSKTGLTINGLGGTNAFTMDDPFTPTGLTSITVSGGPSATNSLTVDGTGGADAIDYTPTAPGAGTVTVNALPAITFAGMGSLAVNGEGGGELLTVTTPSGFDQDTLTPGTAIDSGVVTITSNLSPASATPLSFFNLGDRGSLTFADTSATRIDTLIYDGTTASDTFSVAPTTGTITLSNTASALAQIPVLTPGIANLVLNGISGSDTFDVMAPQVYTSIALEGGSSAPNVANLTGDGTSAVTVPMGGTTTTVTGGHLGMVTLSGVGVINVGNGAGDIDVTGTGLPGQVNDFGVTPTGTNTATIQDNATGPVVNTTNTGALFVGGTSDVGDVVIINGTGANGSFSAFGAAPGTAFTIASTYKTISLVNPVSPPPTPIIASVVVNAGPGNGTLTVNSAAGPFTIPITFNGGSGGGSALNLTGGSAIADVYTPGATPGSGTDVLTFSGPVTQTVNFTNLAPVFDFVAGPLTVVANDANNAITYQEGTPPSLVPTPTWGQVAIDSSEVINFINKTGLIINTLAGNDAVTIDNSNVPTGLTSIAVNGNSPTAGDSLTIDGTTGLDAINYAPSTANPGAGTVTVNALPAVTFTGMGGLAINGQGGNDTLTVTTANLNVPQPVSVTLTPGAAVDSGTVTITRSVGASSSATPLSFSDLGSTGVLSINNGSGTAAGTFVYNGTAANDTFDVAPTTGQVTLYTATGLPQIPVTTSGVAALTLVGLTGNDTFNVPGPQPYSAINLEGGQNDPPVANLTGDGAMAMTTTLGGAATYVTGGGLGTVTLTNVGIINLGTAGSNLSVTGTAGQPDNLSVTPTGPTAAQIQDNRISPLVNASLAGGTLTVSGNTGDSDIVTVNGTAGNDLINVTGTGASTGPIVSVNSLLPVTVGLTTSALNISSGQGNDTVIVNSATYPVTIPVTDIGGGGSDLLILQGGNANTDTYTPGPVAGAGNSTLVFAGGVTESVTFQNLSPVQDLVSANTLAVVGTSSNDTINFSKGSSSNLGLITVDNFESLSFENKTDLVFATGGGDNTIVLNDSYTPLGLTLITVTGGTGNNTLIVNANDQLVSSSQITPTAVNNIVGTPNGTAIPVDYSNMALVHVINSIDALTGIPAPTIAPVAGVQLNNVLVASFMYTDQPPAETSLASEFTATINWGDGTPTDPDLSAGTIIQLAPVLLPGFASPVVEFQVYGTHTYSGQGSFTASVTIYDTGSSRNFTVPLSTQLATITANPGTFIVATPVVTTVSVSSAPITSTGTPTNQVAGISSTTVVATIVDPNPGASVANYTVPGQTPPNISINWGDGTTTDEPISVDPTTGYTVVQTGTQPNGVIFSVSAPHTYAVPGNYTVTTTIYRYTLINGVWTAGSATVAISNELVASAPLSPAATQPTVDTDEATTYPTPEFGGAPSNNPFQLFNGPVAYFTTPTPAASSATYLATIDWGDGTPNSAGTVQYLSSTPTVTTYEVIGTHTYATSGVNGGVGTYPITVYLSNEPTAAGTSVASSTLTVHNTAHVTDNPISVTGILNPSSDTGKNNLDGITYDTQPNYYGTVYATLPNGNQVPDPYAHVTLYANGVAVGTTQAGSDGSWSITSNLLAQGSYTVTAIATDQFGQTVSSQATLPPTLVVDTTAPVITYLYFNRFDATLTVTYQDNVAMNLQSIINSEFYHISATPLVSYVHPPKLIEPTSISYTPGASPSDPVTVNVVFNKGHVFRGGAYEIVIDSGAGNTGVQDLAGNPLAGTFYGTFPTGDGHPGGNFVAKILTFHHKVLPYIPGAGYVPPAKGVDPPAGSGGGTTHTVKHHKTLDVKQKVVLNRSNVSAKLVAQKTKLETIDEALRELVAETKAERAGK